MPQTVEISLRIPSLKLPNQKYPIDNATVRYITNIEVASLPKVRDTIAVPVADGIIFQCSVVRSTWEESKNCFLISCQFAKRSITAAEYDALTTSGNWAMRVLP
jgi:hypothetical protein